MTLVHRRGSFRASQILQQAVLSHPKISVRWNTTVAAFEGGDCASGDAACALSRLALRSTAPAQNESSLAVDAAFVAVGHIPNTALFKGQLEMSDTGYLLTCMPPRPSQPRPRTPDPQ